MMHCLIKQATEILSLHSKGKRGGEKNSGGLEHKKPQQNKMHAQRLATTHTHNQELETFKRKWLAIYLMAFKPNLSLLYALDRKIAPRPVFIQKSSWKYKCLNPGNSEHHLPNILFGHLATLHLLCHYLIHTKKSWFKLGMQAWINGRNEHCCTAQQTDYQHGLLQP